MMGARVAGMRACEFVRTRTAPSIAFAAARKKSRLVCVWNDWWSVRPMSRIMSLQSASSAFEEYEAM